MFLWATFAGIQFGTFEHLRSLDLSRRNAADRAMLAKTQTRDDVTTRQGEKGGHPPRAGCKRELPGALSHFLYGSIAGCAGTVASYPFDITRTALASQVSFGGWWASLFCLEACIIRILYVLLLLGSKSRGYWLLAGLKNMFLSLFFSFVCKFLVLVRASENVRACRCSGLFPYVYV